MLRADPSQMTQWEPLRTQGLATHPDLLTDLPLTEVLGLFHSSLVLWNPAPPHLGVSPLMEEEDLVLENRNQGTQVQAVICEEEDKVTL